MASVNTHEAQGTLFAPQRAIDYGIVKNLEGGYFHHSTTPESEAERAEQARIDILGYTLETLNMFANESELRGYVKGGEFGANRQRMSQEPKTLATEGGIDARRKRYGIAADRIYEDAKETFAKTLGIPTERDDSGKVFAANDDEEQDLFQQYTSFRKHYATSKNSVERDDRRKELKKEIAQRQLAKAAIAKTG